MSNVVLMIDEIQVFEDGEATAVDGKPVTLATLPDPATLNDELLEIWQLTTLTFLVRSLIYDNDLARERYESWEAALNAEYERRDLGPPEGVGEGETKRAALYLLEDGRVVERHQEPPAWLERYDSLAEMRFAWMTPYGEDKIFREALMQVADDLAELESLH